MYIVRHIVMRNNKKKDIRKIIFHSHVDAIKYVYGLRDHETVILFKKDQRSEERRIK